MGMEELKAQRAQLDRIEELNVPGLRVRTPRARMLDVSEVQKQHPDKHLRWVSTREEEKPESRKEEGYMRLTAEEGGRSIGKELVLMAIPKEKAQQRVRDQEEQNALLLDAHKVTMQREAEAGAKFLRDQAGLKVNAGDLLITE
jgi:hypothetical protein